jgi:hypothetical protein
MKHLNRSRGKVLHCAIEPLELRQMLAVDFGDAPDTYGTLLASNGARHTTTPNLVLGLIVDAEADGQPTATALGDDANPPTADDEDGVSSVGALTQGNVGTVAVKLGAGGGRLSAWVDFDANGVFDPSDQIAAGIALPGGGATTNVNFMVPATAVAGNTYARFRLSQAGVVAPGPTGNGDLGEVEDYLVRIQPGPELGLDFGDLPQSATGGPPNYPTLLASNGARHIISPNGPRLGPTIDQEPDGQPNITATGDDTGAVYGGIDDEDGVRVGGVPLELVQLSLGSVMNVQVNNGGANGLLNAWFDWNQNGILGDAANENVAINVPVGGGATINLPVNVPNTMAVNSFVYSRFRISTAGGLAPTGLAQNGEVEDYRQRVGENQTATLDYGDAPDSYRTTLGLNGARHTRTPNLRLGPAVDAELNGQPSPGANRDDTTGVPDDEDGVNFITSLVPGNVATEQVLNGGGPGVLNAWVDFNANGTFDATEQIFANVAMAGASVNNLNYFVPATAIIGPSYARFRLTQTAVAPSPFGFQGNGEVEDYTVEIKQPPPPIKKLDYGDAPDTYGTLLASNGARHLATPNIHLGPNVDAEPDGQPSAGAILDDTTGVPDDEDGVTLAGLIQGGIGTATVINGAGAGLLNAWLDFNQNGVFDPAEQIFTNVPLAAASVNPLPFAIPATALSGSTYARFRISTVGGIGPIGGGGFGEVEDYRAAIEPHTAQHLDFGDAPDDPAAGGFNYHTLTVNAGASHVITAQAPRLGKNEDPEADGQPDVLALKDDANGGPDDEDGVAVGGVPLELVQLSLGSVVPVQVTNGGPATGLLQAWFDWNQNGNWDPAEQVATNVPVPAFSTIVVNVAVPNFVPNVTQVYSRWRISTIANVGPSGAVQNGEVEDYVSRLREPPQHELLDFGDAPQFAGAVFNYPTVFAPAVDPARHIIVTSGPRLGPNEDPEPDGQPNLPASGDDIGLLFGGIDDEDGITVGGAPLETVPLISGSTIVLEVNNPTGTAGVLNAWFDWDQNGTWDAGEQVAVDVPVPSGVTLLPVNVPGGLKGNAQIYSRFRIDTGGGLKPDGLAKDGEVEDYVNRVVADQVGPFVYDGTLEYETRQAITLTFSEPLDPLTVQAGDLHAKNTDDGTTPVANSVILSLGNTVATWVFNTPGTYLSNGDYEFDLAAGAVGDTSGNPLSAAFNLSGPGIFYMAGDADRDRDVDVADLGILSSNWQFSPRTFSQGNFDYDAAQTVNVVDLGILSSNWQQVLLAPSAGPSFSSGKRISDLVLESPSDPLTKLSAPAASAPTARMARA